MAVAVGLALHWHQENSHGPRQLIKMPKNSSVNFYAHQKARGKNIAINKRLNYHRGRARQRHITLEVTVSDTV